MWKELSYHATSVKRHFVQGMHWENIVQPTIPKLTYKLGEEQVKPRRAFIKASQLHTEQFTGLAMDT